MNRTELLNLVKDWRVALLIILVVFGIVSIGPHFDENGQLTTNLQFGLDLQGGAWLQLEFKSVVAGFQTDKPVSQFIGDLSNMTDAEVIQITDNKLEIRKLYTQNDLASLFKSAGGTLTTYDQAVSQATGDDVKRIIENKINILGTKDARVNTLTDLAGNVKYIRVELAGVSMSQAQQVIGKQGKFEIRVQTIGNQSEHIIFGDVITSVGVPTQDPQTKAWGVSFTLSEAGAADFQQGCIKYGATSDPENHELMMFLDNQTVYSAPLSADLAQKLQSSPVRQLVATTGGGAEGLDAAKNLEIHLRAGALPVDVAISGSGGVTAERGVQTQLLVLLAGILALVAVGVVVFYRYREPSIVLPMVLVNASEIIILLGIARYIQQLDLATIAGLIAVLGTGIDQLVIITDEVLHEGRVPSPNLYLKRLTRALTIIVASAATVVIAMLPLALMSLSTLRGFAIITILGVLIGVTITRPAYGRIIMQILAK